MEYLQKLTGTTGTGTQVLLKSHLRSSISFS